MISCISLLVLETLLGLLIINWSTKYFWLSKIISNLVVNLDISYKTGNANIKFDSSKTTIEDIKKAIDTTGFTSTTHKKIEKDN